MRKLRIRTLAALAAASLAAAGIVGIAPPKASAATAVTVTINPSYQSDAFEGWGTSLVWFANATGDYPQEVREQLRDAVFGEEGLNLNIARYNIGGGNATDVPDYLRPGGAVEGWWNPDLHATDDEGSITSTYADRGRYRAAWNGDDTNSYNLSADATQRWWIDAIKADITHWEAFSNSPPYFLTQSGFVSGGINDGWAEQLSSDDMEAFAGYLVTVVDELESAHGIKVNTIDPFNEPNTNYWSTSIRSGEQWPNSSSRQEGAHIGPQEQNEMIQVLQARLNEPGTGTEAVISAMDETNPSTFVTDWNAYSARSRAAVDQYNVHTYGTGDRQVVRDIAKVDDTSLWMSEVEGDWSPKNGLNLTEMGNGLGMAQHITDDLRELEPDAWVFWQPVEDLYNMEKVERLNWGSVFIDFDCNDNGDSERRLADGDADPSCKVLTNSKYNTVRNYTHYIVPGSHLIPTDSTQSTAAIRPDGSGVNMVHINDSSEERAVTIDLSKFASVAGATVTPVTTTESPESDPTANALVTGSAVNVDPVTKTATLTVPAMSVTTFLIDGVTGVADNAAFLQDGHTYEVTGVQSGRSLTAKNGGVVIDDFTPADSANQLWTVHTLSGAGTNQQRVTLTNRAGQVLADVDGTAVAAAPDTVSEDSSTWIVTTTNGEDFSLVSTTRPVVVEVNGQAQSAGSRIGTYKSNGGGNQRWTARDITITGFKPVTANTSVGVVPVLPETVIPLYADGPGAPASVTWDVSGQDWSTSGTVTIHGSGTDAYGNAFDDVVATIEVGPATSSDPTSVTVRSGASVADVSAEAPETVRAQAGDSASRFDAPVVWDFSDLTAEQLATVGVYVVPGTASSGGAEIPATLNVIVVGVAPANIAPESAPTATFTEPGYSVEGTTNLVLTDKAWSNWKSSDKNLSDTLTYTFADNETVTDATVYFYMDGSSHSWATQIVPEYLDPDTGSWMSLPSVPVPDQATAPTVTVDFGNIQAAAVRFVLTARENTHMIVSEVEINALRAAPSSVSTLSRLTVGGVDVEGFSPDVTEYALTVTADQQPPVFAVPTDVDASVDQRSDGQGTTTITVTAPDGTQTTYTVHVTLTQPIATPEPTQAGTPSAVPQPTATSSAGAPTSAPIPEATTASSAMPTAIPQSPGSTPSQSAEAAITARASAQPVPGKSGHSLARTGVNIASAFAAAGLLVSGTVLLRRRSES
ncbi:glycoside hydrolase [Actinomyces glycerinitolerans]|uniref:Glycosyl hydrolase all-beta n=1 Tax=Actinomyces glycerinitolerans TaxID=1892869 RepID=A0A1M4RWT1_9ACTO|nr:glycoside hydrolase [Actinomyces glycerinitolerans]SHE24422.1 glycosyl hydrolase all-beta [Actinomyces glycerinitolerans]